MMNKNTYKSAIDNVNFSQNLESKIFNHLASHVSQAEGKNKPIKNRKLIALATLCTLVLFIGVSILNKRSDFPLPNSTGNVYVKYVDNPPIQRSSADLIWLTEEELFSKYNTAIFKGTVEEINNIKINYNGSIDYRSIAKIKIDKVYRGDNSINETVSVLLPCPIDTELLVEDTDVVSSMRIGTTGIFMPTLYDESFYHEENGAKILLMDIANYGFSDGMRYAFLETDDGLIFDRDAYKSISSASSLKEIEDYILKIINK